MEIENIFENKNKKKKKQNKKKKKRKKATKGSQDTCLKAMEHVTNRILKATKHG